MAFLGILMHIFKKIYYKHVKNAVLAVCAKPVPVWGKRREMRGLLRGEIILTCPFFLKQRIKQATPDRAGMGKYGPP